MRRPHIEILISHLEARKTRNPSYSLRAYARDLALSVSKLSELLNLKKGLSPARAEIASKRLNLCGTEAERFKLSVAAYHSRAKSEREKFMAQLSEFETISSKPVCITETNSPSPISNNGAVEAVHPN